ncbi:hypothetical protein [Luteimonas notoginsengisoli]|jgi:hypothetical protein|uniref:DUF4124 domain-containing protein n=1 Tax=Luteimonas notoginsengisoli TaxID=1578200 RepID=A0ABV7UUT2_9GAMM
MKTTITGLACALLLASMAAPAQDKAPANKKIYCWDENGHKVCGDALPADAADAARTEISARTGIAVRSVERAPTDEERAAAAGARKQAALDAEAEAAAKRRDLAMVESYATEDDLRRAYGERITLVEESLKTSRLGLVNLRQSLLSLLRQAADLELQSKPVNKALTGNIQRQHGDLLRQQVVLEQQLKDRQSLGSDLEEALSRYRALKAPDTAAGNS